MSKDDPHLVYLLRDGPTEVVHLDEERRAREEGRGVRSAIRPRRSPVLDARADLEAREAGATAEILDGAALKALAFQVVEEICARSPGDIAPVLGRLVLHYEAAEALILERFPGPLWIDPRHLADGRTGARAISALAACLVEIPEFATRTTLALLHSPRTEQRNVAAYVARDLARPQLLPRLFELALHDDPSARLAALNVLPEVAHVAGYDAHISRLRELTANTEPHVRGRAIQALEELRDSASVPLLVEALRDPNADIAEAARSALRVITGRDQGRIRWVFWLRANHDTPRFQWLLEALSQSDESLREVASSEIARLTGVRDDRVRGITRARPRRAPPASRAPDDATTNDASTNDRRDPR